MTPQAPPFHIEFAARDRLFEIEPEWSRLAKQALEPNPFYEPWFLLPALQHLQFPGPVNAILVWQETPKQPTAPRDLVALLPIFVNRKAKGFPVPVAELAHRFYFASSVPLVHREDALEILSAIWQWCRGKEAPAQILAFPFLPTDGAFYHLLVDEASTSNRLMQVESAYTRTRFLHTVPREAYYQSNFSGRARKHYRRQKELLSELGAWNYDALSAEEDCGPWVEQFLELEASGWKGQQGTALASNEADATFFRVVTANAHARGQLCMHRITLDGKAVASRCAWRSGDDAFLSKVAYDEAMARYSPGVLLEVECILNASPQDPVWTDSCTFKGNTVYPRLWNQRRAVLNLKVSAGTMGGDLALTMAPWARALKRHLTSMLKRTGAPTELEAEKPADGT